MLRNNFENIYREINLQLINLPLRLLISRIKKQILEILIGIKQLLIMFGIYKKGIIDIIIKFDKLSLNLCMS